METKGKEAVKDDERWRLVKPQGERFEEGWDG